MSETKKEGDKKVEKKDNERKKELEEDIEKASIKGTEASLNCFDELKKLNIKLNQDKSIKDVPGVFQKMFPKYDEHSFTKIRNEVTRGGEMKGGAKYDSPLEEAQNDPGGIYVLQLSPIKNFLNEEVRAQDHLTSLIESGKEYFAVKVNGYADGKLELELKKFTDELDNSYSEEKKIIVMDSDLKGKIPGDGDGRTLEDLLNNVIPKINNALFNDAQAEGDMIEDARTDPDYYRWYEEEKEESLEFPFTHGETGIVFESGDKYYVYLAGKEENVRLAVGTVGLAAAAGAGAFVGVGLGATTLTKFCWGLGGAATGAAGAALTGKLGEGVGRGVPGTMKYAAKKLKKKVPYSSVIQGGDDTADPNLGVFYEVINVRPENTTEPKEMSKEIVKDLETEAYKKCTLRIQRVELKEGDQAKAKEILLDYQTAFLGLDISLLPEGLSNIFCLVDKVLDTTVGSSVQGFSQKWKDTKRVAIKRDPGIEEQIANLTSLSGESLQGTINDITDHVKRAATLKNKTGKVAAAGLAISHATGILSASTGGKAFLGLISQHPVFGSILLCVAIAAKHFKPGEPEDFFTMYIGTELAPQLQRFERKQLTVKTGTIGDLGLPYTKFVTDVLAPNAKGYLTDSELVSIITDLSIEGQLDKSSDQKKKFKGLVKELTLKRSSLNLSSILGKTKDVTIDAEIAKLEAQVKQVQTQLIDVDDSRTAQKKVSALEQRKSEIEAEITGKRAEKTKFEVEKKAIIEDVQNVLVNYLKGDYGSSTSKGGGITGDEKVALTATLNDLLQNEAIAQKVTDHIDKIIEHRVKISKVVEELKIKNSELEEVSPKELSALEQVSKGTHPIIYAKFVKAFGPEKGDKMFNKVFSSTIKRTMDADENLATLFDDDRKVDLNRVLVDENSITRAKLEELCKYYKAEYSKKLEKKKKQGEKKKPDIPPSSDEKSGDIDVSGVSDMTSAISGKASEAFGSLSKLMKTDETPESGEQLLDKTKSMLSFPEVKKSEPESYKPKDYKPGDLTSVTKKELDDLKEAEETLTKQLEQDRAIMKDYRLSIEGDISEHYKVLKLKENQLVQKSDYMLQEQQKVASYYLGVLQNREQILLEQEKILEMKRQKELEEIEDMRRSVQKQLVKELEKEKKLLLKHHGKQMDKQRSLLQEKLKDYKGDNLHLRKLLRKYQKDVPERKKRNRGSMTHRKSKGDTIQEEFIRKFVA